MKKNKEPLYIVRGTGYALDGALVKIDQQHEVDGEKYFSVSPAVPRPHGHESIMVHERYLQLFGENQNTYTYTITVSKKFDVDGKIEQDYLVIDGAYRNLAIRTILNRFGSELTPILRLE